MFVRLWDCGTVGLPVRLGSRIGYRMSPKRLWLAEMLENITPTPMALGSKPHGRSPSTSAGSKAVKNPVVVDSHPVFETDDWTPGRAQACPQVVLRNRTHAPKCRASPMGITHTRPEQPLSHTTSDVWSATHGAGSLDATPNLIPSPCIPVAANHTSVAPALVNPCDPRRPTRRHPQNQPLSGASILDPCSKEQVAEDGVPGAVRRCSVCWPFAVRTLKTHGAWDGVGGGRWAFDLKNGP